MEFTLYTAAVTGAEANCCYPEQRKIGCAEDLEAAAAFDHVCVAFKNDYRKRENFLSSDVLVMDCDNSHTENPAEWMTMEKFLAMIPEVSVAIVPSRNHMKPKDGKCARPRFHVYFGIPGITEEPCYTELKRAVYHAYSFFDEAALDAARFIYGCPAEKVLWQDGKMTIDQVLKPREAASHSIPQGQRNNTMSRFAGRVINRYGATERAYSIFLDEAEKCDPPLADSELNKIWQSAVRFGERIARQEGYVSPEQYNNDFASQGSLKPEDYSDIGQAKVLKREYGDELRYTESTDFLRYNGIYWAESHQEAIGAVEEFLELQLADARDQMEAGRKALQEMGVAAELIDKGGRMLEKVIEGSQQKAFQSYQAALAYYAFVMKRRDMRYIISALQALKPMLLIPIQALDADEFLLNTPSFTYDLRQGMAGRRNHRPEDYITKCTAVDPGEEGEAVWQQALGEFFTGDQELIDYAQEICGLMAIGKVYVEALVIAYGDGRNGKSTYWNSVALVLELPGGEITAANAASLTLKLSQLANGAIYTDDKDVVTIHDRKLDAMEDLVESANGKPVLVAYWFKHDKERIQQRMEARELKEPQDFADWNAGKIPVALIHPASAGHGLNLQQGGSILVWFGLTWSLELYQQTNARLWRQGQEDKTVIIQHIVAKDTIDEHILKVLEHKDGTQAALIEAVKADLGMTKTGNGGIL